MNSQLSRYAVAAVLLPVTLFCVFAENYLFFLVLVLAAGGATWWEFAGHLFGFERRGLLALAWGGWLVTALGAYFYGPAGQSVGLVAALALAAGYTFWALTREGGPVLLNLVGRYALGHLYLSFLLSFFLLLRKAPSGDMWLCYLLLVTMAADTGAYYVGRKVGGPKLCPSISPNKTIAGLVGGTVAATIVSCACSFFIPASLLNLTLLGLCLALWGAAGDLFESALKRAIGIKDSSTLLMGHGGFWDRLDSLLFNVAPVYMAADLLIR